MNRLRTTASAAGLVAGLVALACSYAAAMVLTIGDAPTTSLVKGVTAAIPEGATDHFLAVLGGADVVVVGLLLLVGYGALAAWAGRLRARTWWTPLLVWVPTWAVVGLAVALREDAVRWDLLPVAVGLASAVLVLEVLHLLTARIPAEEAPAESAGAETPAEDTGAVGRRAFVGASGVLLLAGAGLAVVGGVVGRARRHVAESRLLVRIEGLTRGRVPARAELGVPGVARWRTPVEEFFVRHGALSPPTVEPKEWTLRIHGLVEREVVLTYESLLERQLTESWATLACVRNEVGGNLVGNAWWSGVLVADLLAEAGPRAVADCVVQTGADGWNCATPLSALTDDRGALLAVGMNGTPLPIEHGFPARTVVPGTYAHVSAAKWVVDLEVTRFQDVPEDVGDDGWSQRAPVRTSSRIDVPRDGATVLAGPVVLGGVAWGGATGIGRVEVALDGGLWEIATLGDDAGPGTWVQWRHEFLVPPGRHVVVVRATDTVGATQTGVRRDARPDGATGWHQVEFEVVDADR